MNIHYRPIQPDEYHFLFTMLYEALYVRPGQPKFPKSIIEEPTIKKYVEDWNSKAGDVAIVGIRGTELVGVVWGRKFKKTNKGYGFITENTPEISLAVKKAYRNIGIGTALLSEIEGAYAKMGTPSISLSVDKLNPAIKLYTRLGYQQLEEVGTAITMIKDL